MKKLFIILFCLMFLAGCAPAPATTVTTTTTRVTTSAATTSRASTTTTTTAPPPPPDIELTLAAVGDVLLHSSVSRSCERDGGYDYTPLFEAISQRVREADLAFVNQEVMLTGKVQNYPNFAAPFEVADALKWAGFDVVNIATNHSLDQGAGGFLKCLEALKERELTPIGGAASREEADRDVILEINGVRIGFLSYTYGLNGYSLPEDKPWLINLIEVGRLRADARALRPKCDIMAVSMHWGVEYSTSPSGEQRKLAQILCDEGADLIIGTHPHVLQPVEWLTSENGHKCLCAYSLGNYVSGQSRTATMLGGVLWLKFTLSPEKELKSVEGGVIPTVTHYVEPRTGHTVYYLSDYTEELASRHGITAEDSRSHITLDGLRELAREILGDFLIWD